MPLAPTATQTMSVHEFLAVWTVNCSFSNVSSHICMNTFNSVKMIVYHVIMTSLASTKKLQLTATEQEANVFEIKRTTGCTKKVRK